MLNRALNYRLPTTRLAIIAHAIVAPAIFLISLSCDNIFAALALVAICIMTILRGLRGIERRAAIKMLATAGRAETFRQQHNL